MMVMMMGDDDGNDDDDNDDGDDDGDDDGNDNDDGDDDGNDDDNDDHHKYDGANGGLSLFRTPLLPTDHVSLGFSILCFFLFDIMSGCVCFLLQFLFKLQYQSILLLFYKDFNNMKCWHTCCHILV